ncbi:hypothetical protein VNO77_15933 [Canavalia gladiata]|uniref:Uncharacterized protein n=1 Tax=Canavalia gladiata TaxID=3824 RepID=A0AAN9M024_CANGL
MKEKLASYRGEEGRTPMVNPLQLQNCHKTRLPPSKGKVKSQQASHDHDQVVLHSLDPRFKDQKTKENTSKVSEMKSYLGGKLHTFFVGVSCSRLARASAITYFIPCLHIHVPSFFPPFFFFSS